MMVGKQHDVDGFIDQFLPIWTHDYTGKQAIKQVELMARLVTLIQF